MSDNRQTPVWVLLALALYLFFSLTYLTLPGLQYDETNFVAAALGKEHSIFCFWAPRVFGRRVPLMVMSYIGAVKSALYAPIFRFFGESATTVRLPVVIIGFFTLLIGYALFRRMFDPKIASVSLLLLATDPTFIFGNKLDWGPVSLMLLLEMASLYFLWRWMKDGKRYFLGIAGLLLGLGLYNKIIFAWFLAALFISLWLFFRENFKQLLRPRSLACFVPAFLLGCLPLIAFNIGVPMGTFRHRTHFSSFDIQTLRQRYSLFRGTLGGDGIYYFVNKEDISDPAAIQTKEPHGLEDFAIGRIASLPWVERSPLGVQLAGSLFLILIFLVGRRLQKRRSILFLCANLLIMAILICLTPEATGAQHILSLYPLVFIVVGFAACELGDWMVKSRPQASAMIASVVVLPLLFCQVILDARYLQSFKAKGGVGVWSDAIYDLTDYARRNPERKFVLMEWGLGTQFSLLVDGRTQYQEFTCPGRLKLENCIPAVLEQRDSLLVYFAPPVGNSALLEDYKSIAEKNHLRAHLKKTFFQRDGRPVYLLFETVPAGQEQTQTTNRD
jgi:4-amino-4-deoxy-L-arabinose transferase-like glycosyltransferase